jgi:SAM-dependent methyltransferase
MSGAPVLTGSPQKAVGLIRWNPWLDEDPELAAGGTVYAAPAADILARWPGLAETGNLSEIIRRLARRDRGRAPEAVYSDVRTLLLAAKIGLEGQDLHVIPGPSDFRSHIMAIDTSQTILSVKPSLATPAALPAAERELAATVRERSNLAGERYAAVLTDGAEWRLYREADGRLQTIDIKAADPRSVGGLSGWLEAVLATGSRLAPDREKIREKLGAASPSYKLDRAELAAIYAAHGSMPTVEVKRRMWAKLLTTAAGTGFTDNDSLFIDHTLLVATAKVIGHAVLNLDLNAAGAAELMSGALLTAPAVGITGVIEDDFFGWIAEVPGGGEFVTRLARRLARFDWSQVSHDVLKHLYESIIPQETRHLLGEYYTPDWLAEKIVAESVDRPLEQRVLDPSCGSGTFLFHLIRKYMTVAEARHIPTAQVVESVVGHVIGIDVHPVAVTLARITYLLAIGSNRLKARRAGFAVPVFLGDSLRWGHETSLLTYDFEGLSVSTRLDPESFVTGPASPSMPGFQSQLNFPDRVVADTHRFDQLVATLAKLTALRAKGDSYPPLVNTFDHFGISEEDRPMVERTFRSMCDLHEQEKDHIWGYYVRNLARPAWLARPGNQVDVLVGNPPWLVYRSMTNRQQKSFRKMSEERGLWSGGTAATSHDLAGLFAARCIQLYLKPGGRFGYVMPRAVLPRPAQGTRGPHAGIRTGNYSTSAETIHVAYTGAWDLHGVKPAFFRVPASVIFGYRQLPGLSARPMPQQYDVWVGRFAADPGSWAEAEPSISMATSEPPPVPGRQSAYASRFSQGATVLPRLLFLVEVDDPGPLSAVAGPRPVRSRRSATEKRPWKSLISLRGAVEDRFIRSVYLGQCILPFHVMAPLKAIIPWDGQRLFLQGDAKLMQYPGLADWWSKAETIWTDHDTSRRLSLMQRLDYRRGLTRQFPAPKYRVVYSKGGAYLAAAIVTDTSAVIDHKLYWGAAENLAEARYLTAILNSGIITLAVRPMQALGEHNPRDFDKYVFQLPIPRYDAGESSHERLVELAECAERAAAVTTLPEARFELQRRHVRQELDRQGISAEINEIVKQLLDIGA